ncbi:DUF5677 domain-containing protein [Phycisphaerales bacterium AB-hyl4]|uniref:DUF5677 domain-containing protein n=1 Tax=Natronomicrosphaera hydrolytica TaxID=3242702 RepID=A0ABV4U1Q8_9BACT
MTHDEKENTSTKRQQLVGERDYLITTLPSRSEDELPGVLARLDDLRYEIVGDKRPARQLPWGDHRSDLMTWALYSSIALTIGKKFVDIPPTGKAAVAVKHLTHRVFMSADTLTTLRRYAEHEWNVDATSLLRILYDAMLQALYIIADPDQMEIRGELYEGFAAIEKYELIKRVDDDASAFSRRLSTSPLRANAEPRIQAEYQRRVDSYRKPGSNARPHNWYAHKIGTLKEIAEAVGYKDEYLLLTHDLGASVHSSAFALAPRPLFRPDVCLLFAWHFVVRLFGKIAERYRIELSSEERKETGRAYGNIYDLFQERFKEEKQG